jgi:hypothetical protein
MVCHAQPKAHMHCHGGIVCHAAPHRAACTAMIHVLPCISGYDDTNLPVHCCSVATSCMDADGAIQYIIANKYLIASRTFTAGPLDKVVLPKTDSKKFLTSNESQSAPKPSSNRSLWHYTGHQRLHGTGHSRQPSSSGTGTCRRT